jgi:hypothetical protein
MPNLFPIGSVVMTRGVSLFFAERETGFAEMMSLLGKHASGDWGVVSKEDAKENRLSVEQGYRILSAYMIAERKIWIITEADRSATTFLFPEEY